MKTLKLQSAGGLSHCQRRGECPRSPSPHHPVPAPPGPGGFGCGLTMLLKKKMKRKVRTWSFTVDWWMKQPPESDTPSSPAGGDLSHLPRLLQKL